MVTETWAHPSWLGVGAGGLGSEVHRHFDGGAERSGALHLKDRILATDRVDRWAKRGEQSSAPLQPRHGRGGRLHERQPRQVRPPRLIDEALEKQMRALRVSQFEESF